MKRKKIKFKHKNKYIPLALFLIIFVVLLDILALVLYTNYKTYQDIPNYYPGQTDPIKVEEIGVDYPIKPTGDVCNSDIVNNLIKEAENVKFSYEKVILDGDTYTAPDGEEVRASFNSMFVIIENITPNLIVTVQDDLYPANYYRYTYANSTDGKISFIPYSVYKVIPYAITISSSNSECGEQVIKKVNIESPMINEMITYDMCYQMDHIKECSYFTWEEYKPVEVLKIIEKEKKNMTTTKEYYATVGEDGNIIDDNKSEEENEKETKKRENKESIDKVVQTIILIGVVAIVIIILATIIIGSKKRG